jgi:N-acetylmuramoyl-L-alanine amidase
MKRIKNRKKHFRINNPLGFSLFCAMIIVIIGLIVGAVIFITSGGFSEMVKCIKNKATNETKAISTNLPTDTPEPQQEAETTPAPSEAPEDPNATPMETPETGTPVPETPTPPPIQPETPRPDVTPEPEPDSNGPLTGFTIGLDPVRDSGSSYKNEGAFNLEFAQNLGKFLESKGAKVVITRDTNKKEFSNSKRAKTIKNGDCDVAIRLMCNEVGSSTSGCYVQATKKNTDFGQILIDEYAAATGIRIQTGKGKGVEKISSDSVASNCGCPCVRLIMGNWKNKSERANLQDEAFQEKMMQAIYEALLKQLKK